MDSLEPRHAPFRSLVIGVATLVVVADQITKALCVAYVGLHTRLPVIDGYLAITHVRNRGMAFGLLNTVDVGWLRWALVAVALAAVGIIWSYARQEAGQITVMLAFGLILGGAVGNLVDRVRLGYVVDFVLAHWGPHEFPAFNVADSAITMGGVVLFLALARDRGHEVPEPTLEVTEVPVVQEVPLETTEDRS